MESIVLCFASYLSLRHWIDFQLEDNPIESPVGLLIPLAFHLKEEEDLEK